MAWTLAKALDIGGRDEQQDRAAILSHEDRDRHLLVVADGMGGHCHGAAAAQAVLATAEALFDAAPARDPQPFLQRLCIDAHAAINGLGDGELSPGSTCVFLYLAGPRAYWAHVGDSRLYHFRGGRVLGRTVDHSVVQLLAAQGHGEVAGGVSGPLQNQLYMRLGGRAQPVPELGAADVAADDLFLLCSDGFWASVEPGEVAGCLAEHPVADGAAAHLVARARERGGATGDNISIVLAQWHGRGRSALWSRLLRRPGRVAGGR